MSYTELQSQEKRAAKQHRCDWCNEPILKGEKYRYNAGIFEGDFSVTKFHPECVKPCRKECDEYGCFELGSGKRPTRDGKEAA